MWDWKSFLSKISDDHFLLLPLHAHSDTGPWRQERKNISVHDQQERQWANHKKQKNSA
jgi:hypothetical protein